jgi:hypothetical protein
MSDYGLKISLPGYDVNSALPHQCAIHSSYPALKTKTGLDQGDETRPPGFWHFGTVTINFNNDPTAGVDTLLYFFPHQYSYFADAPYTPSCLVRGVFTDPVAGALQGTLPIEPTGTLSIYATTDTEYFRLYIRRDAGWGSIIGGSLTVNYMIFADNGT